ncbi:MAG: hypothetical protein ACXWO3_19420 [Isosphaeraceae bacterium]
MAVPLSGLPPLPSWRGSRTGGLRMCQPGELHGSDEHAAAQAYLLRVWVRRDGRASSSAGELRRLTIPPRS